MVNKRGRSLVVQGTPMKGTGFASKSAVNKGPPFFSPESRFAEGKISECRARQLNQFVVIFVSGSEPRARVIGFVFVLPSHLEAFTVWSTLSSLLRRAAPCSSTNCLGSRPHLFACGSRTILAGQDRNYRSIHFATPPTALGIAAETCLRLFCCRS